MRSGSPLVVAAFINQIGTWVGFTAFVLLWQTFGSQWTVLFMLLSSLGPWALSKKLALRLGSAHATRNWLFLNVSLGLLTAGAAFLTSSPAPLMAALSVVAVVKVTSASCLASMVSTLVGESHRPATFTRLSTVNCVTLALGPALAGYLLDAWSFRTLILVDAASFFVAAVVVALASRGNAAATLSKPSQENRTQPGLWRSLGLATPWLGGLSATWFLLGLAGAVFNMAEIPLFHFISPDDPRFVGWALSSYGVGGLVVFVLANQILRWRGSWIAAAACYVTSLGAILIPNTVTVCAAMALMGLSYGVFNGWLRNTIDTRMRSRQIDALEGWSTLNQVSMATNLIAGIPALLYFHVAQDPRPIILAAVLLAAIMTAVTVNSQQKSAQQ